jgi:hypothetical protein
MDLFIFHSLGGGELKHTFSGDVPAFWKYGKEGAPFINQKFFYKGKLAATALLRNTAAV